MTRTHARSYRSSRRPSGGFGPSGANGEHRPVPATRLDRERRLARVPAGLRRGHRPADAPQRLRITGSLSYRAGKTRANNGILELSWSGDGTKKVHNRSTGTVHFILDVTGAFQ